MSNFYEPGGRIEDSPVSREAYSEGETMHGQGHQQYGAPQPGYGYGWYGYGPGPVARLRHRYPTETKPFFLTSEFWAALVAVVALAITAGASDSIDAWRFWQLATAITAAYLLSRGLAKVATRSHASDPREQLDLSRLHGREHERH
jgi:hypothetical protein